MPAKSRAAFITARKGFCYLTVKIGWRNCDLMRIRDYAIDAQEKRDLRRRYPDIAFDWKKIARQLAEKREVCRRYRSRRRGPAADRPQRRRHPLYAVYDPITRTVYADDVLSHPADALALLDALLTIDRRRTDMPSPPPATQEHGEGRG